MSATSRSPRTLLALLVGPPLLVLMLLGGVAWRLERRILALEETLTAEFQAFAATRGLRPAHVEEPLPGTVAQALAPLLPELTAPPTSEETRSLDEACYPVLKRALPLSELPPSCREQLARLRPSMRLALRASRASDGALPEELLLFPPPPHSDPQLARDRLTQLIALAALEVRLQTEAGQADAAAETCLDALALSRDLGRGAGLAGATRTVIDVELLFIPCQGALSRASPPSLRRSAAGLRRLREGLIPLSSAATEEHLQQALRRLEGVNAPARMAELAGGARGYWQLLGDTRSPWYALTCCEWLFPSMVRHAVLEGDRRNRRLVSLADLPLARFRPALEALNERPSWNFLVGLETLYLPRLAIRMKRQRAEVELLLALTRVRLHRAEHGVWPTALPPLYPGQGVPHPLELSLQPGAEDTLVLRPEEQTLDEVSTPLEGDLPPDDEAMPWLEVTARP